MDNQVHDAERLKELQALPLNRKIQITQARIIEWYQHYNGNVCVSFSGGKDSTVLLHIARQIYPDIPAVFSNTGLEYASIQHFVRSWDNVDIVVPKMRFNEVVSTYGYPLIGKEVAEAIYYARRLRSQNVNAERENDLPQAQRTPRSTNLIQTSIAANRRTILIGRWLGRQGEWKRLELMGGDEGNNNTETSRAQGSPPQLRTRTKLEGRLGVNGEIGVGGAFSDPSTFGERSQFNKEKWLPLVYTPIPISHYCCHKIKKTTITSIPTRPQILPYPRHFS